MRRVGMILFAAALGLAVVTGCSGEEEPSASSNQGSSSEGSAEDNTTETEGDTGQDTEADGGSASAYCEKASQAGQKILSPDANSADLVQVYRDIAAVAPADIKADWTTIADSMETLQQAQDDLANPDTSDPDAAMKDLEKATQQMEKMSTKLQTATQAITDDLTSRCSGFTG